MYEQFANYVLYCSTVILRTGASTSYSTLYSISDAIVPSSTDGWWCQPCRAGLHSFFSQQTADSRQHAVCPFIFFPSDQNKSKKSIIVNQSESYCVVNQVSIRSHTLTTRTNKQKVYFSNGTVQTQEICETQ
jgi:hypothetical protein